jgi:hypothetical protein
MEILHKLCKIFHLEAVAVGVNILPLGVNRLVVGAT